MNMGIESDRFSEMIGGTIFTVYYRCNHCNKEYEKSSDRELDVNKIRCRYCGRLDSVNVLRMEKSFSSTWFATERYEYKDNKIVSFSKDYLLHSERDIFRIFSSIVDDEANLNKAEKITVTYNYSDIGDRQGQASSCSTTLSSSTDTVSETCTTATSVGYSISNTGPTSESLGITGGNSFQDK